MIAYFIRHGETDYNKQSLIQGKSNIPLNETGLSQAETAAEYFREKNIKFDKVYASPLIRAHKTASIVSGFDMADIKTDARVKELDFGAAEGMNYRKVPKKVHNLFTNPTEFEAAEGGETIDELKARCRSFLDELAKLPEYEPETETILIASHGAALRGLLSCIDKCPLEKFWKKGLWNCCVVKTHLEDGEWVLDGIDNPLHTKGEEMCLNR